METVYLYGVAFGLAVLCVLWAWMGVRKNTSDLFFVSGRTTNAFAGVFAVYAVWTWANAIIVSAAVSYEHGIAGFLWFAVPNTLALLLFAVLVRHVTKQREEWRHERTFPQLIDARLGTVNRRLYAFVVLAVQVYAVVIQLTAAVIALSMVTDAKREVLIVLLGAIFLVLPVLRGIRSSLVADAMKAFVLLVLAVGIVPYVTYSAGGVTAVAAGWGGVRGTELLDANLVFQFGIPVTISLFAAAAVDQQLWQRAFSMPVRNAHRSFFWGTAIFAVGITGLGVLGLIAANAALGIPVANPQEAGFSAIIAYIPHIGGEIFILALVAALIATGSSALNAAGVIGAQHVVRLVVHHDVSEIAERRAARVTMVSVLVLGVFAALRDAQLATLLVGFGALRGAYLLPTLAAMCTAWRMRELPVAGGIIAGVVGGPTLFLQGMPFEASMFALLCGGAGCLAGLVPQSKARAKRAV